MRGHRQDVLRAEAHSINLYVHWHTAGPEYRFTTGVGDFAANTGDVVYTAANLSDAERWLTAARAGYAHCEREIERRCGPIVNGEQFAPGYTHEAAAYEQRTRLTIVPQRELGAAETRP